MTEGILQHQIAKLLGTIEDKVGVVMGANLVVVVLSVHEDDNVRHVVATHIEDEFERQGSYRRPLVRFL